LPLGEAGEAAGLAPILLGSRLAESLNLGVGDVVTVTSPQGRLSPVGLLPRIARVRVVGTVKTGFYEFDAGWGYLPLAAARRLLDEEGRTLHVEVRLDDMFAVKDGARRILAQLGEGYVTTDWVEMNQSLYSALWIEKVAIGIAIGLIVAVAALNIVATLVLMVMEKHKTSRSSSRWERRAVRSCASSCCRAPSSAPWARRSGARWAPRRAGRSTTSAW
jgi:lipoprotein-releasing system permease protein